MPSKLPRRPIYGASSSEESGDGEVKEPQTVGHMVVYVDDLLITGSTEVVDATLKKVQARWKCSDPEWMAPEGQKPMTFCGFEIKKGWSLRSPMQRS